MILGLQVWGSGGRERFEDNITRGPSRSWGVGWQREEQGGYPKTGSHGSQRQWLVREELSGARASGDVLGDGF